MGKINRETYLELIKADIDALEKVDKRLEKEHIISILLESVDYYYNSEGNADSQSSTNCAIFDVMQRSELLTDFMEMIEEGGMIQFDKPKLLNQFKNRQ